MTELNLPFVRYVKQVSNGIARTKYSYLAMQDDLLEELKKKSAWKLANCAANTISTVTNKVTQTDAEYDEDGNIIKPSSYTAFIDDRYDAFKQGGDANTSNATFCGYAGMVAYRFTLPSNQSSNISEIVLKFQAARYLRSGLKIVVVLNDSAEPSNDWSVIRGEAASTSSEKIVCTPSTTSTTEGVKSWGFLSQDVPTLIDSRASEGTFTFDAEHYSDIGTSTRFTYMWVYVSIEDYTDYWTYYDSTTPRYYSIEGSATLVASKCSVKFDGTQTVPTTLWRHTLVAVPRGFYMPYSNATWGSQWSEGEVANREAFGNLLDLSSFEAGMILDSSGDSTSSASGISVPTNQTGNNYTARLLEYASFPRKDTFTKFYQRPTGSASGDNFANLSDVGVFAVNPAKMELTEVIGSGRNWENNGGSTDDTIWYNILHTYNAYTQGPWADVNGVVDARINGYAMLYLKSTARIVPHGKSEYNKMCVLGTWTGTTVTGTSNPVVEAVINIWKCSTHDTMGYWRIQAISALLSHQELYTVSEKSLSVKVTGDGTWSSTISVSPTAEYVGSMPIPNGSPVEFNLDGSVAPGDMLIFVPQITYVPTSQNTFENNIAFDYILVA